jgi:hypothetical protein
MVPGKSKLGPRKAIGCAASSENREACLVSSEGGGLGPTVFAIHAQLRSGAKLE